MDPWSNFTNTSVSDADEDGMSNDAVQTFLKSLRMLIGITGFIGK